MGIQIMQSSFSTVIQKTLLILIGLGLPLCMMMLWGAAWQTNVAP